MDQRTLDLLIDRGVIDEERVTAKATHRHCRSCRRVVLAALADDGPGVAGIRTTLDPRPVTPLGELMCLSVGRLTYFVKAGLVSWRDVLSIRAESAAQVPVYAEHRCGDDEGIDFAPILPRTQSKTMKGADECPPF